MFPLAELLNLLRELSLVFMSFKCELPSVFIPSFLLRRSQSTE